MEKQRSNEVEVGVSGHKKKKRNQKSASKLEPLIMQCIYCCHPGLAQFVLYSKTEEGGMGVDKAKDIAEFVADGSVAGLLKK